MLIVYPGRTYETKKLSRHENMREAVTTRDVMACPLRNEEKIKTTKRCRIDSCFKSQVFEGIQLQRDLEDFTDVN